VRFDSDLVAEALAYQEFELRHDDWRDGLAPAHVAHAPKDRKPEWDAERTRRSPPRGPLPKNDRSDSLVSSEVQLSFAPQSSDWSMWLSGSRWRGRFGYGQVAVSIVAKSRLAHVQLQVTLT
jgi:hypothetical protein